MKNTYNIKNKHKNKGNYYAGKFQNSGFIPLKKEKTRFSIGDNVINPKRYRGDGIIKKLFYNKYNKLKCVIKEECGFYEYECFTWELILLPLTRKVLFEKHNKKLIVISPGITYSGVTGYITISSFWTETFYAPSFPEINQSFL